MLRRRNRRVGVRTQNVSGLDVLFRCGADRRHVGGVRRIQRRQLRRLEVDVRSVEPAESGTGLMSPMYGELNTAFVELRYARGEVRVPGSLIKTRLAVLVSAS